MNTSTLTRRSFVSAASAALVVTGLAACSGTSATTSSNGKLAGSIRVTFGTGSQQAPMDKLVAAFQKANPGTQVKVNYLPATSITQSILTELRAGNGPDVFYSNGGSGQAYSVLPLAKAGMVAELDGSWTSLIPDAAKSLYERNGKVYGLPLAEVPIGLIYDKAAFKSLGIAVPTSIDELIAAGKTAAAKNKAIITMAGTVAGNIGVFGQAVAASYVYAVIPDWNDQRSAGKVTFAGTQEWTDALQSIIDLHESGAFIKGVEGVGVPQIFNQVANGQALSAPGPAGVIDAIKAIKSSADLGLIPFPGKTSADTRALIGYTDALAVNAKSTNLPLAKAFVNFVGDPDNANTYTDALSAISLSDAKKGIVPDDARDISAYLKNGKVVSAPNQAWPNADVYDAFTSGIQGLLTGQSKPAAILAAMDRAWG